MTEPIVPSQASVDGAPAGGGRGAGADNAVEIRKLWTVFKSPGREPHRACSRSSEGGRGAWGRGAVPGAPMTLSSDFSQVGWRVAGRNAGGGFWDAP